MGILSDLLDELLDPHRVAIVLQDQFHEQGGLLILVDLVFPPSLRVETGRKVVVYHGLHSQRSELVKVVIQGLAVSLEHVALKVEPVELVRSATLELLEFGIVCFEVVQFLGELIQRPDVTLCAVKPAQSLPKQGVLTLEL